MMRSRLQRMISRLPAMPEPTAAELKAETKGLRPLAPFGLNCIRMETPVTSANRIVRRGFPLRIVQAALGIAHGLTRNQFGWFRAITVRRI